MVYGWEITSNPYNDNYTATKDNISINFKTDAGKGSNYSKVESFYSHKNYRMYTAQRYLIKYVSTAQDFSNVLYKRWQESIKIDWNEILK